MKSRALKNQALGFTLIEMIIEVAIMGILVSVAIPIYQIHIRRAHEAVLKEDLYTMRNAIDQFTQDKSKAPQDLNDLVTAGYLRAVLKIPSLTATRPGRPYRKTSRLPLTRPQLASPTFTADQASPVRTGLL